MYKSPIDVIHGEMNMQLEGEIFRAVQNVGVYVDKEELLRALAYDRNQYEKGYDDGYAKSIDECYMKAKTMMDELSYQNQGRRNGKTHRLYCIQALEFLRQVAERLKEG